MAWGTKEKMIAAGTSILVTTVGLGVLGTNVYNGITEQSGPNTTQTSTSITREKATPTASSAAGTPNPNTNSYTLQADQQLGHGECTTVNVGSSDYVIVEGDVAIGPVGTPYGQLRRVYDNKQQTGLIIEDQGPLEVCAPYGADIQVVGPDQDAAGYLQGQDIEGMKSSGCGLTTGCSTVDVIKATSGIPAAIQGQGN